jgi:CheY-like chemotaxis protein
MRIIRSLGTDYAQGVPIIALTANAIAGNEQMFLSHGFQDFISKPVDLARLDTVLRRWVRDKSREQGRADDYRPAAEAAVGGQSIRAAVIEGLDLERTLRRFNGDEATVAEVLASYARNTLLLLSDLNRFLDNNELAEYSIAVHGIKGSSFGICADTVGRAAEKLEADSNAAELSSVRAAHPEFEAQVRALIRAIEGALSAYSNARQKSEAPSPDPGLLAELRRASASFDMDGVDGIMERLESFSYEKGAELVSWLREQVDKMNFETIASGDYPYDLS